MNFERVKDLVNELRERSGDEAFGEIVSLSQIICAIRELDDEATDPHAFLLSVAAAVLEGLARLGRWNGNWSGCQRYLGYSLNGTVSCVEDVLCSVRWHARQAENFFAQGEARDAVVSELKKLAASAVYGLCTFAQEADE